MKRGMAHSVATATRSVLAQVRSLPAEERPLLQSKPDAREGLYAMVDDLHSFLSLCAAWPRPVGAAPRRLRVVAFGPRRLLRHIAYDLI